ncbi:hypothetical protein Tco_1394559 [Tanacetum coccineum]
MLLSSGTRTKTLLLQHHCNTSRFDWDLLFQLMFDESLNVDLQAPEVIAPIPEAAPEHAVSTGSPSSTTVDQDAPSPSNSHTTQGTQTPIIFLMLKRYQDIKVALWVMIRYFVFQFQKFLLSIFTFIRPMQEELHEFERLEVWELVPPPDKAFVISLKWIYKVKLDELGVDPLCSSREKEIILVSQRSQRHLHRTHILNNALESLRNIGYEFVTLVDSPMALPTEKAPICSKKILAVSKKERTSGSLVYEDVLSWSSKREKSAADISRKRFILLCRLLCSSPLDEITLTEYGFGFINIVQAWECEVFTPDYSRTMADVVVELVVVLSIYHWNEVTQLLRGNIAVALTTRTSAYSESYKDIMLLLQENYILQRQKEARRKLYRYITKQKPHCPKEKEVWKSLNKMMKMMMKLAEYETEIRKMMDDERQTESDDVVERTNVEGAKVGSRCYILEEDHEMRQSNDTNTNLDGSDDTESVRRQLLGTQTNINLWKLTTLSTGQIQRQLYTALVDAYEADRILLDTYGDTVTIKRPRDGADDDQEPIRGKQTGCPKRIKGKSEDQFYAFATSRISFVSLFKKRIIAVTKVVIVEWQDYKHLDWITVQRDDDVLYKFKEGDFHRLRIQDIEDMLLLLMQGKVVNISTLKTVIALKVSLVCLQEAVVSEACGRSSTGC